MKIGQRVRLVEMRGCMAHVRHDPREGVVTGFVNRMVYGGTWPILFVKILLDNGERVERVAEPRLWSVYEGLEEYRDE